MSELQQHEHPHPPSEHERTDVSIRVLVTYLGGLVVCLAVIILALVGFWKYLSLRHPEQPTISRWSPPRELPPSPRLQTAPDYDLQNYLAQQRQRLHSYGWVDKATGTVHIPIEDAINKVASQGPPAQPAGPQTRQQKGADE